MSTFKDIVFSSMDSDLGAATAAALTCSQDEDLAILSAVSDEDGTTTESSSEAASSSDGGNDEYELGEFLWDAFDSSSVSDFADLCPA